MVRPRDRATRARLRAQGRRDTAPELALRSELHRRGLRYRVDRRLGPGVRARGDIVFGPSRVVVFVDGCFWHRCPEHATIPTNNREWWVAKLGANVQRDLRVTKALETAGWEVIRIWEHDDPEDAADRIEAAVRVRRA